MVGRGFGGGRAVIYDDEHGFGGGFGDVGEASGNRESNRANLFTARHRPYMWWYW